MSRGIRWLCAVAAGVAVFEGLDLLTGRLPGLAWLTLASPFVAGGIGGWVAGGGIGAQLLVAVAVAWGRIGIDRAIGSLQGVPRPDETGLFVMVAFGVMWTLLSCAGAATGALIRWVIRRGSR
jgi:hypothetical protein